MEFAVEEFMDVVYVHQQLVPHLTVEETERMLALMVEEPPCKVCRQTLNADDQVTVPWAIEVLDNPDMPRNIFMAHTHCYANVVRQRILVSSQGIDGWTWDMYARICEDICSGCCAGVVHTLACHCRFCVAYRQ
jgi:hypothetical protein